jgi:polyhydroxyalkanoate synthesis regulator phasin
MPKRKSELSQKDQSERFVREVERLIAAGELSPTEANRALDDLVRKAARQRPPPADD